MRAFLSMKTSGLRNGLPESVFWIQVVRVQRRPPVSKPDYYRQYAFDCMRLANEAQEPSTKAVLIDMAQSWIRLSEHAQRNRRLEPVQDPPAARPAA